MKHSRSLMNSLVLAGLLFFILTHDAHAYLDPGGCGYAFQVIIVSLVGAAFAVRIYWKSIKEFFSNLSSKGQESEDRNK